MTKSAKSKTAIIAWLKKCSIAVCVLCAISAFFNLKGGLQMLFMTGNAEPGAYIFEIFRKGITCLLLTVIMGMGAVMFFRISKEDSPFRDRNVRTVHIIGVLFLVTAFVPAPAAFVISTLTGAGPSAIEALLINLPTAAIGLLMLFIGQILHYGAMLQQESDETL
ncbi:MAG: DUF2975 domain-containing protein [Oscillospiraceae bacterium]|nr:DUF2975 domain-containing protein [Oscillospiraceae bacterium]